MSALDIALIVILSYFLLRGIFRGMIREIVGNLGIFIAFWVASVYWPSGSEQLKMILNSPAYRGILSFIIIYIIVYFLIGLMSVFVDKIVKIAITPFWSGFVGGLLGILKGLMLCLVLMNATMVFVKPEPGQTFYSNSIIWPKLEPFCLQVKSWLPQTLLRNISQNGQVASGPLTAPPKPPAQSAQVAPQHPATINTLPTDYQSLIALVKANSGKLSVAWLERINSTPPQEVNADFLRRFVQENSFLFDPAPVGSSGPATATTSPSPPDWPRPANE
ncbi:MAG: CvpA family protein [Deltaproteobacteria bacterium]|jgi:membrane protein required for colicin V production|nr:CvpA family protein [Deltaproteobacteria bacterium]